MYIIEDLFYNTLSSDSFVIQNLNDLYQEYFDYRVRTVANDDFFAFDEFCNLEYHDAKENQS